MFLFPFLFTHTIYDRAILLNKDAIAVSQDPLGQMGMRVSVGDTTKQIWARNLANGDVAVALYVILLVFFFYLLFFPFFFLFFFVWYADIIVFFFFC